MLWQGSKGGLHLQPLRYAMRGRAGVEIYQMGYRAGEFG